MKKLTNEERRLWLENDEGLYRMRISSGLSIYDFINKNRKQIDGVIKNILSGKKKSHYLVYG